MFRSTPAAGGQRILPFLLIALLVGAAGWISPRVTCGQEEQQEEQEQEQKEQGKSALDLLDEATDLKLQFAQQRYSVRDLERVVTLCEAALEAGLDEGNETYAKQLLGATLYEQAQMLIGPVLEGDLDRTWPQRRELALEKIQKAVQYTPQDAELQLLLAKTHGLPGGDHEAGRAAANVAIELLEDNPARQAEAYLARAAVQDSNEQRLADYDAAISQADDNLRAYRERGRARLIAGEFEQAAADLRHVLAQQEDDLVTIELLTETLIAQDKFDEAVEQVSRLIEVSPNDQAGLLLRASLYVSQNQLDKAIDDLNTCLRGDPTNVDALLGRAALREATGEFDEALSDVGRTLELRPGYPRAILLRSQIAASAGDFAQSISDLQLLVRQERNNLGYQLQLAATYLADHQPVRAIEVYDKLLAEDDEFWPAVRGRADAYLGVGKHVEAVADYRRALQHLPDDSHLLNNLAWVLATSPDDSLRNASEALELATKACEITEYKQSHILSTLAASYADLGQFEAAIEWSTKAVELEEGELRAQLEAELKSYQEGKPWRERQQATPPAEVAPDDLLVEEPEGTPKGGAAYK